MLQLHAVVACHKEGNLGDAYMLPCTVYNCRHKLLFTNKSRGVKREGDLSGAECASKTGSPSPNLAGPGIASAEAGHEQAGLSVAASDMQMEGAADTGSALGTPPGPAEVEEESSPEATGKAEPLEGATTGPAGHPVFDHHTQAAAAVGSESAGSPANGGSSPQQGASARSSSSSEAERGPAGAVSLEAADLLASLNGEGSRQSASQPKPGLQGVHLDLSKRSTEDQPAWYCLIPMAKPDSRLSKASHLFTWMSRCNYKTFGTSELESVMAVN